MSHLEVDRVLAVIGGSGTEEEHAHLRSCETCDRARREWSSRVSDLRVLEDNAVEPSEIHNLRVLYRELGPAAEARGWLASLVRHPKLAAEAVRGELSASLDAYCGGPYEILLQVRPSAVEGRFDVQGQVADKVGDPPESARVVLTSLEGHVASAGLDGYGEFRLAEVPPGTCRVVWLLDGSRIDLEELEVGEQGGNGE